MPQCPPPVVTICHADSQLARSNPPKTAKTPEKSQKIPLLVFGTRVAKGDKRKKAVNVKKQREENLRNGVYDKAGNRVVAVQQVGGNETQTGCQ